MALHEKNKVKDSLLDDVYAASDLSVRAPKYRFPRDERIAGHAYRLVRDELLLDGVSRLNLATFCQTWLEPEIHRLMDQCLDKNMIDKDEYPQTAELEARCVHMLADLWNSPEADNTIGCSTTGSSEAAMLGGMALKWRWRQRMQAQGKPRDKPNLVCGPVQICWHKFSRYWEIEHREVPMQGDRLIMTPEVVAEYCDQNTIGVVATLGVTYTGQYEDVKGISQALDRLQAEKGWDIPIHVDAASGGFLAPFCDPDLVWDFRLPRVVSINASGHKFGLAPLGVGWVIWRDRVHLPEDLVFKVNYLGGEVPTFALNFSRPGGQIVAQYYNFLRLGREGYRRLQQSCYDTAAWLGEKIGELGPFRVIHQGKGGIPALLWTLADGAEPGYSLYDLSEKLRSRGWQVPAYSMPAHRQDLVVMRALIRHGFSRDMGAMLLEDIKRALDYFARHPVSRPLTAEEAGGFSHNAVPSR